MNGVKTMWNLTIGKNIECALEAVLFSLGEEVEIEKLAEALEVREDEVIDAFEKLQNKYKEEAYPSEEIYRLYSLHTRSTG